MKRFYSLCLSWLLGLGYLWAANPLKLAQQTWKQDIEAFRQQVQKLNAVSQNTPHTPAGAQTLRQQVRLTRLAWKNLEALAEYLDTEGSKDHINGAPLPRPERNAPEMRLVEPSGLQTLDELVWEPQPWDQAPLIAQLCQRLAEKSDEILNSIQVSPLQSRWIFEGQRQEIIRLTALGLSGFDTPGSASSLPEVRQAMNRMETYIRPYILSLPKSEAALAQDLNALFRTSQLRLRGPLRFESFDRASYIRQVLNPLYGRLLDLQLALGIETWYETPQARKIAWNPLGRTLFGADLLDANYYTHIPKDQDTPALAQLGQYLFFDPILSGNGERSCASCHRPDKAFTDGQAKSLAMGLQGTVDRNSPTLLNAVYAERYFWDLRADQLEDQVEHVITDSREFHTRYDSIVSRLRSSSEYRQLFRQSFPKLPNEAITAYSVSTALAAYVKSLQSWNSPFDRYMRRETASLAPEALRGFNLFMGKAACGTCHFAPLFSGTVPPQFQESESEVLGVTTSPQRKKAQLDPDRGRAAARLKENTVIYEHSFKTPTVRHAAQTAPYFHNGAFATLEQVMQFYNDGGGRGWGLNLPYQTLSEEPLTLKPQEIKDIISFMKALSPDVSAQYAAPKRLPAVEGPFAQRKIGGLY